MTLPIPAETRAVLDALHEAAQGDAARWQAQSGDSDPALRSRGGGDLVRMGEFYLAATPEDGRLLYLLARATKARRIVEFGASFGISALYLAAAAQANGGSLITTEVHPDKCAALRQTFDSAGMADHITLLEGDARETLGGVSGPVDILYLDGWKSAYLPVFTLMRPKLAPSALVLADNCFHEAAQDYLTAVQTDPGCLTEIRNELAITCMLG